MLSATLYIAACSMRNRTRRWLRRLREPRYLFGLIAVAAYFYVTFFARMRAAGAASRRRAAMPTAALFGLSRAAPIGAGVALLVAAGGSWLVPAAGRLLDFTPAEVQFLFPAPVHRRQLLIHRLLRSQAGLLFASLIPALAFSLPRGSATTAVQTAIAMWVLLMAARAYFSGVTLARSRVMSSDPGLRLLARMPLVAILAGLLVVGSAIFREYARQTFATVDDGLGRLTAVLTTGGPRIVLWPFVALIRPFFAADWTSYASAVVGGLAVVTAAMVWVLASDEAFQEATGDAVERQHGRPQGGRAAYRARNTVWRLAPTGRAETAFVWKCTMQVLRVVDRRVLWRFAVVVLMLSFLIVTVNRARGFAGVVGLFAAACAAYSVLLAPQILRLDLRQDLQHLELLKTWPIRAAVIVRGEMMGPALVLSGAAWGLIGLALFLSTAAFSRTSAEWRVAIAAGGLFLAPALIFGQYAVHNGAALLFPAWVPLGTGRPRGLDAMGQRLLTLGGTWLALAVLVAPGAAAGAVLWFAFYRFIGPLVAVVASAVCAAVMALEILMMTEALGPAYERLDLMAVERPD